MKVGILTSSRADFGIYLPLVKKLFEDDFFRPEIIAFGTHLSQKFGMTIGEIENEGFPVRHKLQTMPDDDTPLSIAHSISKTIGSFSEFWNNNQFDLVFALGDRFEMLAAVLAGSPFNVTFAHIHAGETTLGAIDNSYRHGISLMSDIMFVSTDEYKQRAIEITNRPGDVYNIGALSIDNLKNVKLFSVKKFYGQYKIDLTKPTILSTFHPETVNYEKNIFYIDELLGAFDSLKERYQIIVTMPNADTMGMQIRDRIEKYSIDKNNIVLVESLGMKGYLSCMKHCKFMIGNTSSGFVEAAFFPKYVINLGKRQEGRILTPNIFSIPIKATSILNTVGEIEKLPEPSPNNIYGDGETARKIVEILKKKHHV